MSKRTARLPGSGPSKRAQERAALQELYRPATLEGLQNLLDMGKLDLKEVRKYYTDARAIAQKAIERIQQSDVPFVDAPPMFPKTRELTNDELLRAVADVNRFIKSPTRKISQRRIAYKNLLDSLHEKGLTFLRMEDLSSWDRYRKWLRASNKLNRPYGAGDILGDIFARSVAEGKANSKRWQELYDEVMKLIPSQKNRKRRSRARRK